MSDNEDEKSIAELNSEDENSDIETIDNNDSDIDEVDNELGDESDIEIEEIEDDNNEIENDEDDENKIDNVLESKFTLKDNVNFDDDSEDYESDDDEYLKKFEMENTRNVILDYHEESKTHNYDEINTFSKIIKDNKGNIIDPFHKTIPILTKYEKTRILGQRAKQINHGAKPFVIYDKSIIDGYLIAQQELQEKKIPFIIRRPIPGGGSEYWKVKDLELIDF
jgi:DNA-directed RNA polymerase I, II, and III subunit RPABC2